MHHRTQVYKEQWWVRALKCVINLSATWYPVCLVWCRCVAVYYSVIGLKAAICIWNVLIETVDIYIYIMKTRFQDRSLGNALGYLLSAHTEICQVEHFQNQFCFDSPALTSWFVIKSTLEGFFQSKSKCSHDPRVAFEWKHKIALTKVLIHSFTLLLAVTHVDHFQCQQKKSHVIQFVPSA